MDEILNISGIISSTFKNINFEKTESAGVFFEIWKKILFSLNGVQNSRGQTNKYEGQNLYEHSRVVDLKNGILLVEADHPGWIQLLQIHKKYILIGLKKEIPQLNIRTIVFRLKGIEGGLSNTFLKPQEEEINDNIRQTMEKEEKALGESNKIKSIDKDKKSEKKTELPPELKALFDDLKESVLTNSKN